MVYVIVFFLVLILLFIYALIKSRRKKIEVIPESWHPLLMEHVQFYKELTDENQKLFKQRMMVFLNEVFIEAVKMELEELDKVLVAASAVIPVFGFKEWHYTNLSNVLLYPDNFNPDLAFDKENKDRFISGLVGTGQFEHHMILSKKALYDGFRNPSDSRNTGVHEFVHLIDKLDGITDGVPEILLKQPYIIPWMKLIHKKMEDINNNQSDIRSYGGTNEAEFLAVASEYFFEQPEKFQKNHPLLYKMLLDCFQVAPQKSKHKNTNPELSRIISSSNYD